MGQRRRKTPPPQAPYTYGLLITDSLYRLTGKNVANPIAMILCVALMFRYSLGMEKEAQRVEEAVRTVLDSGTRTADLGGTATTREVGDAVVRSLGGV